MELMEAIETRRSVRRFADRQIEPEVLKRVLGGARLAPSGSNRQPWRLVIVTDKARRTEIARHCYDQMFVAQAPAVVVCCAVAYETPYEPHAGRAALVNAIIAVDHLTLAARNEGLGTCWVGAFHDEPIARLLNVPEGATVAMVVPMGYPADDGAFHGKPRRKPLDEMVFDDEFGKPLKLWARPGGREAFPAEGHR